MNWLTQLLEKHPEYRGLPQRKTANAIHFQIEPPCKQHGGIWQAHIWIDPRFRRTSSGLWLATSRAVEALRVAGRLFAASPKQAAAFAAMLPFGSTFTDGYGGTVNTAFDTGNFEFSPDTEYSTATTLTLRTGSGVRRLVFLYFDVSSLSSATISAATMTLTVSTGTGSNQTVSFYPILSANSGWVESLTWNYRNPSTTRWAGDTGGDGGTDAGCSVSGTDYRAVASGTISYIANAGLGTSYDCVLTPSDVQAWVNGANYGLVGRVGGSVSLVFCSSDHATTGYRPKLVVTYTVAASGGVFNPPVAAPFRGPFGD